MGLATPMAVMVATGLAAQRGCMVKSAEALESSARLDVVILDKTGTITEGAPVVSAAACMLAPMKDLATKWQAWRDAQPSAKTRTSSKQRPIVDFLDCAAGKDMNDRQLEAMNECFWWLLGTVESASDHPIARCITDYVKNMDDIPEVVAPRAFDYASGRGVTCVVDQLGGVTARVGNVRFFEETSAPGGLGPLQAWLDRMQGDSHTVVLLHVDGLAVGAVAMKDALRDDAQWVVNWLQEKIGAEVWMCTGDNTATAQSIANEVGIKKIIAEALPSTKKACVQQLQEKRKGGGRGSSIVAFVGD
eukprot:4980404-Amphidinium_carterae.1